MTSPINFGREFLLAAGRVGERFGALPHEVAEASLEGFLFDIAVLNELVREDRRAMRRARRRG